MAIKFRFLRHQIFRYNLIALKAIKTIMKMIHHKKLLLAISLMLITTIGFWACRKQDYKIDDLQIASKEL